MTSCENFSSCTELFSKKNGKSDKYVNAFLNQRITIKNWRKKIITIMRINKEGLVGSKMDDFNLIMCTVVL